MYPPSSSSYDDYHHHPSENDTVMLSLPRRQQSLDEIMTDDLAADDYDDDALFPIDHEDLLKSFSSMSFDNSMVFQSSSSSSSLISEERNVSFGGIQSIDYIESARDMTDQDIEDRWFTKSQLYSFKRAARELCRKEKEGNSHNHAAAAAAATNDDDDDDSTRGMEVYFPARQKSHGKYIFHVLDAIHVQCKGNPEYVAQLCEKWSTKNRDRALATATQDFYHAYLPHMASSASSSSSSSSSAAAAAPPRKRVMASATAGGIHNRPNKRSAAPAELSAPERTRSL